MYPNLTVRKWVIRVEEHFDNPLKSSLKNDTGGEHIAERFFEEVKGLALMIAAAVHSDKRFDVSEAVAGQKRAIVKSLETMKNCSDNKGSDSVSVVDNLEILLREHA